ncbi:AarF/ABC1/UbiB kinase family protein [Sagittula sp. NFXS13]|uniref:ABC1 kinase family protein n=1 Tax=Sagittula sp. NFXS13 TaxID=2819095 RepID=UPI0032DE9C67
MSDDTSHPVPQSRFARAAGLGRLTSRTLAGAAFGAAGQLARGHRPTARGLMLTPANISRLTEELSRMRGAAMKLGQLISMETDDLLPPDLAQIMARLRADAKPMPPAQLKRLLTEDYGANFQRRFKRFDPRPIAAASIGQVHRAETLDGRPLALKIQYPGIARAIDADIANLGTLIRLSGLLPRDVDLPALLEEARLQLHEEADYAREAANLREAAQLLGDDPGFALPTPHDDLSTPRILAMDFMPSQPLDTLEGADQDTRDRLVTRLFALFLREVFDWGAVQTDPNLANYRLDGDRIVLLDYGALRHYSPKTVQDLRQLLRATATGDGVRAAMDLNGYTDDATSDAQWHTLTEIAALVRAPLTSDSPFDFGDTSTLDQARVLGQRLALQENYTKVPPVEALFLQRKLAGLVLMATTLRAKVPLSALVRPYLTPG